MPDQRKRMVVEEVESEEPMAPVTEDIKGKVEELQDITEHIAEDVKASAEVQEEIKQAVSEHQEDHDEYVPPKQAPNFNPLVVIIPGILLLGALLGGIVFYQKTMNKEDIVITPEPTAESISPTASPTATSQTSLTKYSIAIQNGSGIAGEAGRTQTLVESAGFKVSGTGNADSYTYTKTIVKVKSTVEKDFTDALIKALGKNYTVDKAGTLASTSKDDVQVVVGSLKATN